MASEQPQQNIAGTEDHPELDRIVSEAFESYKERVGDYWSGEEAIREIDVNDFVRKILSSLQRLDGQLLR